MLRPVRYWNVYPNFTPEEFRCRCGCGTCLVDREFLNRVQQMRTVLGRPMPIVSGCRCPSWNEHEGGLPNSAHLTIEGGHLCRAGDIGARTSRSRYRILKLALEYFPRIGLHRHFIHVDDDPGLPAGVFWLY